MVDSTGEIGTIGVIDALIRRAEHGGSFTLDVLAHCDPTSFAGC
jgi:hypothetical protein